MVPSDEWRVRSAGRCCTTETLSTLKAANTAGRSVDSADSVTCAVSPSTQYQLQSLARALSLLCRDNPAQTLRERP